MTSLSPGKVDVADMYLDLLKKTLTGAIYEESDIVLGKTTRGQAGWKRRIGNVVGMAASSMGLELTYKRTYDPSLRENGRDWPVRADSMIGLRRMDNIQYCMDDVLRMAYLATLLKLVFGVAARRYSCARY